MGFLLLLPHHADTHQPVRNILLMQLKNMALLEEAGWVLTDYQNVTHGEHMAMTLCQQLLLKSINLSKKDPKATGLNDLNLSIKNHITA